ncbi:MAG TPA: hypothetical protein VH595_20620 [Verrucomicrobiae bacterium]|jgi:uncharacterized protein involved in outer membrane biogenesis|nr:hypothetical protein [Verrucomicrobiae bacterium]
MKRKWILGVLLALVVVFLVAVVAVAFSLGAILKKTVQRIGPDATKVDVKLKSAGVWIVGCRVELTGFVLGNPPGYKTPTSIDVGDVSVRVKARSVFSNKLILKSIKVKAPVITWEGGWKENNLTKIEKNLNDYIGSSSTAPDSTAPSLAPAKSERKLQVDDLLITGAKLQVNTKLSGGRTLTLTIPEIHLTDLGTGPEGITGVEVGQRALHAVLIAATTEIAKNAGQLGTEGLNDAKGAAKKLGDKLKGLFH